MPNQYLLQSIQTPRISMMKKQCCSIAHMSMKYHDDEVGWEPGPVGSALAGSALAGSALAGFLGGQPWGQPWLDFIIMMK